jgi:hypothetical protein
MEKVSGGPQRACGTPGNTPQEAKAEVYKELGYRQAGMVGDLISVSRFGRATDDGAAICRQEQLFYSFNLEDWVPGNHLIVEL